MKCLGFIDVKRSRQVHVRMIRNSVQVVKAPRYTTSPDPGVEVWESDTEDFPEQGQSIVSCWSSLLKEVFHCTARGFSHTLLKESLLKGTHT